MSFPVVLLPNDVHSQQPLYEGGNHGAISNLMQAPEELEYTVNDTQAVANLLLDYEGRLDLMDARGLFEGLSKAEVFHVNAQTYLTSGKVLEYIVNAFPNLIEFTLDTLASHYNNNDIDDEDLLHFARLEKLQRLTIKAASEITAEGLKTLIEKCTKWVEFATDLACFGDAHVKALVEKQKNLKVLTVTGQNKMSLKILNWLSTDAPTSLKKVTTKMNVTLTQEDDQRIKAQFAAKGVTWIRIK